MRLGGHKPNTETAFVDGFSGEVLLRVATDALGKASVGFRIFDATGGLVSDSGGLQIYPSGLRLHDCNQVLLLLLPSEPESNLQYRLYSPTGRLLTVSDGARTQIFPGLQLLDGSKVKSLGG